MAKSLRVEIIGDASKLSKAVEGAQSKLSDFSGKAATLLKAGGAAGAAAFGAALANAMSVEKANDRLAAQLGATGKYAKDLGKVAGDLYAGAYGDSLGQVNEALKGVLQNGVVFEDATDAQLEAVTAKVLDLAAAFEVDLGGATQAVGQLLRNDLAPNADAALDIITRGFQQGVDKSGDYLDTLNEYGTQFRALGIDAAEATGLMSQGLQAGARDADTVADALKEFAIRGADASKASAEGFEAIGLSASEMTAAVAAGGDTASGALQTVLDGLRAMDDPVERNAAAVALFGTKAEDLGEALYSLDPSSAVAALGDIGGAAERMGNTLNDNASTTLETFKREALQRLTELAADVIPVLADLGGAFMEHVAPAVGVAKDALVDAAGRAQEFFQTLADSDTVTGFGERLTELGASADTAFAGIADGVTTKVGPAFETLRTIAADAVTWLAENVLPPIQSLAADVGAAFGDLVGWVREHWDAIEEAISHVVNVIAGVIRSVIDVIAAAWRAWGDDLLSMARTIWDFIRGTVENAINLVAGVIETVLAVINGDWDQAWAGIKDILAAVWDQIFLVVRTALDLVSSLIGGVVSTIQEVWSGAWDIIKGVAGAAWEWVTRSTGDALSGIQDAFQGAVRAISGVWAGIQGAMAGPVNWVINNVINKLIGAVNSVAGKLGLGQLIAPLAGIPVPSVGAGGGAGGGAAMRYLHTGGIVGEASGDRLGRTGPLRGDEIPAVLQRGEGVLPAGVVRSLGAAEFESLRRGDPGWVRPAETDMFAPETGGPFDWVADKVAGLANAAVRTLRGVVEDVARPVVNQALDALSSMPGAGTLPGQIAGGAARTLATHVLDWIGGVDEAAKKQGKKFGGGTLGGAGWQALVGYMAGTGVPHRVTSTVRPGAITGSGNVSRHARGLAADFAAPTASRDSAGLGAIFEAFLPIADQLAELIYAGPQTNFNIKGGKQVGKYAQGIHHDHVHAATYDQGGWLEPGTTLATNRTGRRERVITGADEDRLVRLLEEQNVLLAASADQPVQVWLDGEEITARVLVRSGADQLRQQARAR